jgi:quercetin dioxygenase-like cupin family protein
MKGTTVRFIFDYNDTTISIFHVNKGEGHRRHSHPFTHGVFCTSGSCVVRKEGKELIIDKFTQPVNLLPSEWHEIEALEDNTVFVNVFEKDKY